MEQEIDGIDLIPATFFSFGWKFGPPRGIMIHSSQGSLSERLESLNDLASSVHFSIDSSGEALQFVSIKNRSWHSFEASDYYFGIEHLYNETLDEFTRVQIEKSIEIAAILVKLTKDLWGMKIPVVRAPGPGFSPGFKEHKDGLESTWNTEFHRDRLSGPINWQQYLDLVNLNLEDDDMALFESKEDFRKEALRALVGADTEGNPTIDPDQFAESLKLLLGMNLRMKGGDRPDRPSALQKGWDLANQLMKIDPEAFEIAFPSAKLSGSLTFS